MYSLFGTKFSKMLCGPMWSQASISQAGEDVSCSKDPIEVHIHVHVLMQGINCYIKLNYYLSIKAQVNVPALGERTMRRRIVDTEFSNSWNIQVCIRVYVLY